MRRRSVTLALLAPVLLVAAVAAAEVRAGGGCHDTPVVSTEAAGTSVVKMDGCAYAPAIARVAVGTTVRFLNTADTVHDVTGRGSTWRSPELEPGAEWSATFRAAGVYPYSCSLHPGMAGMIVVGRGAAADGVVAAPAPPEPTPAEPTPATAVDLATAGVVAPTAGEPGSLLLPALTAVAGVLIGATAVHLLRGRVGSPR